MRTPRLGTVRSGVMLAVLVFGSVAGAQQPAPTTLRYAFVAGQRVRYASRSVQVQPDDTQVVVTSQVEIETLRTHPDGSADQRLRVLHVEMPAVRGPAAAVPDIVRRMNGMTLDYTQDPRGRITARQAPGGVAPEVRPLLDSFLQTLDQMAPLLPEQPVAVGSTWNDHKTLHIESAPGQGLDLDESVTYTLRELRPGELHPGAHGGPLAVIGVAMTIRTPRGANIAHVPVEGTGNAAGDLTLDLGRGVLAQNRSAGTMTLRLSVPGRSVDVQTRFDNDMHLEPSPGQPRR